MFRRSSAVLAALLGGALGALAQPGNWQPLAPPEPGADRVYCFGMNPRGDMVGSYRLPGATPSGRNFLLTRGTYTAPLPYGARGINASGHIAGDHWPSDCGGCSHGVVYSGGEATMFRFPGGEPYAYMTHVEDINPRGDIVGGYMDPPPAPRRGFLRDKDGTFTAIDYPVTPSTRAFATNVTSINPQGDIVGNYTDVAGGKSYGFLRTKDGVYTQIYFPGATSSAVDAINARGEIVGWYWSGTGPTSQSHGFLYQDGVYTTVDYPGATHTMIHGLNSEGEMCGMMSFSAVGATPVWGGFSRTW